MAVRPVLRSGGTQLLVEQIVEGPNGLHEVSVVDLRVGTLGPTSLMPDIEDDGTVVAPPPPPPVDPASLGVVVQTASATLAGSVRSGQVSLSAVPRPRSLVYTAIVTDKQAATVTKDAAFTALPAPLPYLAASVSAHAAWRQVGATPTDADRHAAWAYTDGATVGLGARMVIVELGVGGGTVAHASTAVTGSETAATSHRADLGAAATRPELAVALVAIDTGPGQWGVTDPVWTGGYAPAVTALGDTSTGTAVSNGGASISVATQALTAVGAPAAATAAWSAADQAVVAASRFTVTGGTAARAAYRTKIGTTMLNVRTRGIFAGGVLLRANRYTRRDVPVPAPVISRRLVGVDDQFTCRVLNSRSVRLKVGTDEAVSQNVRYTPNGVPNARGSVRLSFATLGLAAGTYYYRVAATDEGGVERLDNEPLVGRFVVWPVGAHSFTVVPVACHKDPDKRAVSSLARRNPDLVIHMGDQQYADDTGLLEENFAVRYHNRYADATYQSVFARTRSTITPSDHCHMYNNYAGGDGTAKAQSARDLYTLIHREYLPTQADPAAVDAGHGFGHTFVRGRVRFIVADQRSFMSAASATDNASKTKLGAKQKTWVKNLLGTITEPIVMYVSDVVWMVDTAAGSDGWGGYNTERQELVQAFEAYAARVGGHVFVLSGDAHSLGYTAGRAVSGASIPNFVSSPLGNVASAANAAYTEQFPATGGALVFQYGTVDVTDTGGTNITVTWTGYSAGNPDTQRMTFSKVCAVAAGSPSAPTVTTWNPITSSPLNTGAPTVTDAGARLSFASGNSQWARQDWASTGSTTQSEIRVDVRWDGLEPAATASRWAGLAFGNDSTPFHDGNAGSTAPANGKQGIGYRVGVRQNGGMIFGRFDVSGGDPVHVVPELAAGTLPAVTAGMVETIRMGRRPPGHAKAGCVYVTRSRATGETVTMETASPDTTHTGVYWNLGKFGSDGINVSYSSPVVTA